MNLRWGLEDSSARPPLNNWMPNIRAFRRSWTNISMHLCPCGRSHQRWSRNSAFGFRNGRLEAIGTGAG